MIELGVGDMVWVCDGLMSGTADATGVLRVAASRRRWPQLYVDHVHRADPGADFDLLVGASGPEIPRESP